VQVGQRELAAELDRSIQESGEHLVHETVRILFAEMGGLQQGGSPLRDAPLKPDHGPRRQVDGVHRTVGKGGEQVGCELFRRHPTGGVRKHCSVRDIDAHRLGGEAGKKADAGGDVPGGARRPSKRRRQVRGFHVQGQVSRGKPKSFDGDIASKMGFHLLGGMDPSERVLPEHRGGYLLRHLPRRANHPFRLHELPQVIAWYTQQGLVLQPAAQAPVEELVVHELSDER